MKRKRFKFQNCVILDSNETNLELLKQHNPFQNCVILDSNETEKYCSGIKYCFRIVLFQIVMKLIYTGQDMILVLELCYFRQ